MSGQPGRSGGWNRLPAHLWTCVCGRRKTNRYSLRCRRCHADHMRGMQRRQGVRSTTTGRLTYQHPCSTCGGLCSRGATQCKTCECAVRSQRSRPETRCLGCGRQFQRKRKQRDVVKYCSRACAFAHWSDIRRTDIRAVRARARPPKTYACCNCGAPLLSGRRRYCEVCRNVRAAINRQLHNELARERARQQRRHPAGPIVQICPSCGAHFDGRLRVCCSRLCLRRAKKVLKGLQLSHFPASELAPVAELIATMRAAYRHIDTVRKGYAET